MKKLALLAMLALCVSSCSHLKYDSSDSSSINYTNEDKALFHTSFTEYLKSADFNPLSSDDYDVSFVDLNNDGRLEAIALVSLWNTGLAGNGGGTMFIFMGTEDGKYQFVSRNTATRKPIYARQTTNRGWRDLVVHSSGGGIEASDRIMVFDGESYPQNPSIEPKTTIIESDVMVIGIDE